MCNLPLRNGLFAYLIRDEEISFNTKWFLTNNVQYKQSGNENSGLLNAMVLPATVANCRSRKNEERKRKDRNRQTTTPITNLKDASEAKKCVAYAETFILKLGAQYEAVTTQANFMGVISVKSKSSFTSSVFFLSM